MEDIFGKALHDFYHGCFQAPLLLHNEYGDPEDIPIETYFRKQEEFTELETFAMKQVRGKILDIGAAAGRHAIYLQNKKCDVTAIDISMACCQLMKDQGIKKVINENVMDYDQGRYETIILLMNGAGIIGSLSGLGNLLLHLKNLLNSGGQILLDSTDIAYLYDDTSPPEDKYYGELTFHYEYKGMIGEPFNWVYIDQDMLTAIANDCGWHCQVIFEDETDAYLARLTQE